MSLQMSKRGPSASSASSSRGSASTLHQRCPIPATASLVTTTVTATERCLLSHWVGTFWLLRVDYWISQVEFI